VKFLREWRNCLQNFMFAASSSRDCRPVAADAQIEEHCRAVASAERPALGRKFADCTSLMRQFSTDAFAVSIGASKSPLLNPEFQINLRVADKLEPTPSWTQAR
jgi:hypothetical protein